MLTRRHIRVKVLQSIYAYKKCSVEDLDKQEKFLWHSIDQMQELYALLLLLTVALRDHAEAYLIISQKKHLATDQEKNPSRKFIDNKAIKLISRNTSLLNVVKNKKINNWKEDDEYVAIIFRSLLKNEKYQEYLRCGETSFNEDRDFLITMYKEVIAPNDKLYEYLEDKQITWIDDFPIVNTALVKVLSKLSEKNASSTLVPVLFKNEEDRGYVLDLLRKVILNDDELAKEIDGKTPNWDQDRIAEIDMIILKMGITEFLKFPTIPVKVTINEYLEISKEYSTPKSSLFINGILDNIVKEFTKAKKIKKIGRGLR